MAVINVNPGKGVKIDAGTIPTLMHVYNVGPSDDPTRYGITVGPDGPTFHDIQKGHTDTYTVNRAEVRLYNNGPDRLQLLYGAVQEVKDVDGATEDSSLGKAAKA